MAAKFYIYWNLHKNCYSVKLKGKVVAHAYEPFYVKGVTFKVNEAGRKQVLKTKRKNVHAYVVADEIAGIPEGRTTDVIGEAHYNPYKVSEWVDDNGNWWHGKYDYVHMNTCDNKPVVIVEKLI